MKDLPSTLPERRRTDTVAAPPLDPEAEAPRSPVMSPMSALGATHREVLVPSATTVGSILAELRKPPGERFEIQARAAEGGMGTIDVAIDRALDRRIAVKTLHTHLQGDDSAVRMFLREARLTALLDHPHIVPVYDLGERDGARLYFAMKLVEGQTLADVIRALPAGPLDSATLYELIDVVAKICDALAFAHSRGVLHCDIKPANVMVGEFGQVYVMDWGIARLVAAEASPASAQKVGGPGGARMPSATDNSVIGTPGYMSPEQARGDRAKLDPRSDVFLVGALLYEVLTGQPPYRASDRAETLALAAAGAFAPIRAVRGEATVPLELERIVLRAMAKEPSERYPSIAAMRDDLVHFMRGAGAEFPRATFAAGEAILREGETGDAAYIIVDGRCDVSKSTPAGDEVIKTIGPGDVFGEMALLSPGPRTATIVATEETTVLVVTAAMLDKEMSTLKPWIATLLRSIAARFRDVDTKQRATFAASPAPPRLANQLFMHLVAWGTRDASGGVSMPWSRLAAEIGAQLGAPPLSLFAVITRYGLELDLEGDRLTLRDPKALAERIARDLG
jgi:serine/threonine-protein kinase